MFEFEQYEGAVPSQGEHPALDAESQKEYGSGRIRSHSEMSWGEHCSECAFPSCYLTCSFYKARPDGRCRRFNFGIYRAPSPTTWMKYSAYIEFKNWSKLWTQGNATQLPDSLSNLLQFTEAAAWGLSTPFDRFLQKAMGRKRLSLVIQSLRRRIIRRIGELYSHFPKPDCLLIEIFNPMTVVAQMHLAVKSVSVTDKAGRFEWVGNAAPGFSSFAIPISEVERFIDLSRPFEMTLSVAEEDQKKLYFCSASFVRLAKVPVAAVAAPKEAAKRKIKCVIWDLDNTLWSGTLLENGTLGVKLIDGLQFLLRELDRRGILLSIASKNSEEDARQKLEQLGLWELFLAPQINWQPKSESIQRIAKKLNLGLDAFAFVDDMPFEQDEVAAALPTVLIIPADQCFSLLERPEFVGDSSSEGASRRKMYQAEANREQAMASNSLGYDAFMATCDIRVRIDRPGDDLLPRIQDIVERTNQLNIASQRYSPEEMRELIHSAERDCYIVSCSDNYGDYGHVGFICVSWQDEGILIRDCMFSCRIQGKGIDEAVLAHLINHYLSRGATAVRARFIQTKRNVPAGQMLGRLGFVPEAGAEGTLAIEAATPRAEVPYVRIQSDLGELSALSTLSKT
ncbi:MAG TPA: HAD-IIIC family phosphatase [Acidobacteriaceae bacterium]|jgi:FkbH-like protein|nr:HAD-IIIC family phosphatase [Acidobacteriaceae bacterium]